MNSQLPIDTEREVWYNENVRPVRGFFFVPRPTAFQTYTSTFGEIAPCGVARTQVPPTGLTTVGIAILHGVISFMSTSKLQEKTKERLRLLLVDYDLIENYRPDWLKNPETGRNLELDFYLPDVKVGVEVQGRQHYEFVPHFHGTIEAFYRRLRYDRLKRSLCLEHGVHLYEVFKLEDIGRFIESTAQHCQEMSTKLFYKHAALKSLSYYAAELHREKSKRCCSQERLGYIAERMMHIAQKHNIELVSIRADFDIERIEMAFMGNDIVRIHPVALRTSRKSKKAAIISIQGNVVGLRWLSKFGTGGYENEDFDLITGKQISHNGVRWRLDLNSLPTVLIERFNPLRAKYIWPWYESPEKQPEYQYAV